MILKAKELREKTVEELAEQLAELRTDLFKSRMSFYARKLENVSLLKELKKSIARVQTVLNQKESEEVAA